MLITLASETIVDRARDVAADVLRAELARFHLQPSERDDPHVLDFALEQASDVDLYRYATTQGREGYSSIDSHLHLAALLRYRTALAEALAAQYAPLELQPHHFQTLAREAILQLCVGDKDAYPSPLVFAAAIAAGAPFTRVEPDGTQRAAWCRSGTLHRDPMLGPALTVTGPERQLAEYYLGGKLHRPSDQGPAVIEKYRDGTFQIYHCGGAVHRPTSEGPAEIVDLGPTGGSWIAYKEEDTMHRPAREGPAYIFTDPRVRTFGDVLPESDQWEYRERGELHRPSNEGPAFVQFRLDDGALSLSYWENGKHLYTLTEVLPC